MPEFICVCCHKPINGNRNPVTLFADNGSPYEGFACDSCRLSERTAICLGCWHRILMSDAVPHPNGVNHLCPHCSKHILPKNDHVLGYEEEHNVVLPSYGYGKKLVGFELEYMCRECPEEDEEELCGDGDCDDCKYLPVSIFNQLNSRGLLPYAKSTLDASVTGEVVTAPFTLKYLHSRAGKGVLDTITDIIKLSGGEPTPTKTSPCKSCGGHIHVARDFVHKSKQDAMSDVLARLTYMTRAFWHKLSRRDSISQYATYTFTHRHGTAINYTARTYEFRFWGASLNPDVLRARAVMSAGLLTFLDRTMSKSELEVFAYTALTDEFKTYCYEKVMTPFMLWLWGQQYRDEVHTLIHDVFRDRPVMSSDNYALGKIDADDIRFDRFVSEVLLCQ